ncbi:hypothetical protein JW899_00335 [Candidatus Uhrbacteria bacterium]|nr:hypothetical protein [Candidatus Uhrbacteria bacterium]
MRGIETRKHLVAVVIGLSSLIMAGAGCTATTEGDASVTVPDATPLASVRADRVEVVHFHGTTQCYSCRKVGELAFRTVKERFPAEWKDGTVRFVEVDGELPENREVVMRYQATGSSLFLNAIAGDREHISEDATVWRLTGNESRFLDYLEGQIRTLLGR